MIMIQQYPYGGYDDMVFYLRLRKNQKKLNMIKIIKMCIFYLIFVHSWCIGFILHSGILECFSSVAGTVH